MLRTGRFPIVTISGAYGHVGRRCGGPGGGSASAGTLVSATPAGQIPEIPAEKSSLNAFLDELPKVVSKFTAIEDKASKVVTDVGAVATKVKENPSLLLRRPKKKDR